MSKSLVIVESPTKAKTITRFLGSGVQVMASQGHIRDLPEHSLGVDIEKDFTPVYELTSNGKKKVSSLKTAAASAAHIYLATDPDREGEAIAWHLKEVLKNAGKGVFHRITFHEITKSAIERSIKQPGDIAYNMVDAQQARRVLDRIVGYQVSPMLWRSIRTGTSAGRVQTVALRLVVEKEREIQNFVPVEYWNFDAVFNTSSPKASFKARLARINGDKVLVSSGDAASGLAQALQSPGVNSVISKVTSTPRKKNAPPPFITSTLQQAAGSAMKMGASQTMKIAQELYEGIDLGSGQVGLITYMRTDSVNIAKEAQAEALDYIRSTYGAEYVPDKPNSFRSRKTAQEAHEAIRPTSMQYAPDSIAQYLSPQQLKIYRLIWNRFIASQMASARQMDHVIEVDCTGGQLESLTNTGLVAESNASKKPGIVCQFRAAARETVFPGYLQVYSFKEVGEDDDPDEALNTLPKLPEGAACLLKKLDFEQCFTQPPSRFTEASLVKALEQNGVGRPSTYAATVNTIQERDYVSREKGSLIPTQLGFKICDFLVKQMPALFDITFTAQMEDELDQIEEGRLNWTGMLKGFYEKFKTWSGLANHQMPEHPGEIADKFLVCFTEDFPFAEPAAGNTKYDDRKIIASIRQKVTAGKSITQKTWDLFILTVARYANEHPELMDIARENGLEDAMNEAIAKIRKAEATPKIPVAPEVLALLEAMKNVEFNPPVKRFKRTFDDAKFVKSIRSQVATGKGLSEPQTKALLKLSANYAAMIPGHKELYAALAATLPADEAEEVTAAAPAPEVDAAQTAAATALADMISEIREWKPASGKGRKTFDDKTFAESVLTQFRQKGSLSERQISALARMAAKYADQIKDYESRAAGLKMPEKQTPQVLDEVCPQCGSKLVKRFARGRSFIGCSGYPKCRYIAKKQG